LSLALFCMCVGLVVLFEDFLVAGNEGWLICGGNFMEVEAALEDLLFIEVF